MLRITPREREDAPEFEDVFSRAERAALRMVQSAGSVPNAVTDEDMEALKEHFDEDQIVELVGVVCLFGWLNRWNDTMATPLEERPIAFGERHLGKAAGTRPSTWAPDSPHFSPGSRPASRPGVRSARSGPKSVAGTTVEARDAAGGRLGATRRAASSGRQGASRRLPDVPASRRAPLLPCRPDDAAQAMTLAGNAGWPPRVSRTGVLP